MHKKGYFRHLVLFIGIPLSVGTFYFLRQSEKKAAETQFAFTIENRTLAVRREINSNLAALSSLRAFLEAGIPNESSFQRYSEELGRAYPSIQSLEWIPRVPASQRQAMEQKMSRSAGHRIVFHEGPRNAVKTSPVRKVHYPVEFYWGRVHEEGLDLIGIDVTSSMELSSAMNIALETGEPASTQRWPLREKWLGRYGVMAFLPVFQGGIRPPPEKRSEHLSGYAFVLLQVEDLLKQSLASLDKQVLDIYFFDKSASVGNRELFFHAHNPGTRQLTEEEALRPAPFRSHDIISVANREWVIVYDGSRSYLSSVATWQPYLFLLCGLFASLLVAAYLNTLHRHAILSHAMVDQLTLLNRELHRTIAEQKEVEKELAIARDQALTAAQSKSRFLANMSHEIRTPMNGILGLTSLVLKADLLPEQRAQLETVQDCSEDLLRILDSILDLSKSETGKLALESIPFILRENIVHVTDLYAQQAKAKHIAIHLNWSSAIPETLLGDSVRIRQIFTNLINNAIKFTEKGSVTIEGNLVSQNDSEVVVRITIRDTGIGISEEGMTRLFQPFSQADDSTTRKYGGTGLGLTIVKQLVDLMKGTIKVRSTVHQGTVFELIIPFLLAPAQSLREYTSATSEIPAQFSGRVLLVEDNAVNQLVQRKLLESIGFQVDVASHGKEAVILAQETRYTSIFMDCQMPEMDGYEATRLIRKIEQNHTYRTPIIALTAHAFPEERMNCLQAGMDAFLTKPIRSQELVETVAQLHQQNQDSAAESH